MEFPFYYFFSFDMNLQAYSIFNFLLTDKLENPLP